MTSFKEANGSLKEINLVASFDGHNCYLKSKDMVCF